MLIENRGVGASPFAGCHYQRADANHAERAKRRRIKTAAASIIRTVITATTCGVTGAAHHPPSMTCIVCTQVSYTVPEA
jgi:uncharacterized OB-fold protein